MSFNHSQQVFIEGDLMRVKSTGKTGLIYIVIPTPGGWVYTIKYDEPDALALEGGYGQFFGDELESA